MSEPTPFAVGDFAKCRRDPLVRYEILSNLHRWENTDQFVHKIRVHRLRDSIYRVQPTEGHYMPSEMLQILPSWNEVHAVTGWKPNVRA